MSYNKSINGVIIGYVLNFILLGMGAYFIAIGLNAVGAFVVAAVVLSFAIAKPLEDGSFYNRPAHIAVFAAPAVGYLVSFATLFLGV